jgi:hypothetical protein
MPQTPSADGGSVCLESPFLSKDLKYKANDIKTALFLDKNCF